MNTNINAGTNVSNTCGTPIPGVVGWTYEDAFAEVIEDRRDARLYGSRKAVRRAAPVDNFQSETGWTREDALAMAFELRSDERLYGTRH